jgi:hypothetical protein
MSIRVALRSLPVASLLIGCGPATPPVVTPPSAVRAITVEELRRDLFAFSADSMLGRETGTPGETKAARFLVQRLTALGVEPAGDSMYYQRVPLYRTTLAANTRFGVTQGQVTLPLALGNDLAPILALGPGAPLPRRTAEGDVFFAGYGMTEHGRNDFKGIDAPGKVIVMLHGAPRSVTDSAIREKLEGNEELGNRIVRALPFQPAAIVLLLTGDRSDFYNQALPSLLRGVSLTPDNSTSDSQRPLPMVVLGLAKAGLPLLPASWPAAEEPQALTGKRFSGHVEARVERITGYNIAGIVRGSDARLNKSYVALGSHYDHVGIQPGGGADTIANGADDDGSGSVTMLAIARSMMTARPRRSTLFVWHAAEEKGLLGSEYFATHSTVPIDSIVAMINLDMIGRRGGATSKFDSRADQTSGENRLFILGPASAPNNQSVVLGAIFDTVNARQVRPFIIDRAFDNPTHPERYYERSDHINYAKKGIPVLFFSTGFHEDYHKVSDEPHKIDYDKMSRIGGLLLELATTLGNRETRPR